MIKSKFQVHLFISMVAFPAMLLFFIIVCIIDLEFGIKLSSKSKGTPEQTMAFLQFLSVLFSIYMAIFIMAGPKRITIDAVARSITFKNIFTGVSKTYPFESFDGFVETIPPALAGSKLIALFLIKDGKFRFTILEEQYRNFQELKEGLAAMPYLGFYRFKYFTLLRLLYGKMRFDPDKIEH